MFPTGDPSKRGPVTAAASIIPMTEHEFDLAAQHPNVDIDIIRLQAAANARTHATEVGSNSSKGRGASTLWDPRRTRGGVVLRLPAGLIEEESSEGREGDDEGLHAEHGDHREKRGMAHEASNATVRGRAQADTMEYVPTLHTHVTSPFAPLLASPIGPLPLLPQQPSRPQTPRQLLITPERPICGSLCEHPPCDHPLCAHRMHEHRVCQHPTAHFGFPLLASGPAADAPPNPPLQGLPPPPPSPNDADHTWPWPLREHRDEDVPLRRPASPHEDTMASVRTIDSTFNAGFAGMQLSRAGAEVGEGDYGHRMWGNRPGASEPDVDMVSQCLNI